MNFNHPLFKQIHKISRRFGAKPMFLDYDMEKDKPFLRPYKKYKDDCLDLIFVKGIPIKIAYKIYGFKGDPNKPTKINNLFYNKKFNLYTLVDTDGLIQFILKVEDNIVVVRKNPVHEGDLPTIYALNSRDIYQIAEQIKNENRKMFYFE